jgi:hypothetical protein
VGHAAEMTWGDKVGSTAANQNVESHSYNAQTGLLDNQSVAR